VGTGVGFGGLELLVSAVVVGAGIMDEGAGAVAVGSTWPPERRTSCTGCPTNLIVGVARISKPVSL